MMWEVSLFTRVGFAARLVDGAVAAPFAALLAAPNLVVASG